MKTTIRKGTFETNSSSAHSLMIMKNMNDEFDVKDLRKYYCIYNEINKVYILDMTKADRKYFGRSPFDLLMNFYDKLAYAIACNMVEEAEEALSKKIGDKVTINYKVEDDYWGTDEYQLSGWLKDANVTMYDFLFNERYVVIVDGDEYCIFYDLIDSDVMNTDEIESIIGSDARIFERKQLEVECENARV